MYIFVLVSFIFDILAYTIVTVLTQICLYWNI